MIRREAEGARDEVEHCNRGVRNRKRQDRDALLSRSSLAGNGHVVAGGVVVGVVPRSWLDRTDQAAVSNELPRSRRDPDGPSGSLEFQEGPALEAQWVTAWVGSDMRQITSTRVRDEPSWWTSPTGVAESWELERS